MKIFILITKIYNPHLQESKNNNQTAQFIGMIDQGLKFSTQYSYRLKILLLGPKQSGKSSLIYTYKHQAPPLHKISSNQTDAVIKKIKYIKANRQGSQKQHFECNIHLWDTTSQESPDVLKNILIKRTNAIILVFDRHQKSSFERMKMLWAKIEQNKKQMHHVEIILIGNIKEKKNLQEYRERRKNFDEEFRRSRSIVVLQDENLITSRFRRSSYANNHEQDIRDDGSFTNQIQNFARSEQMQYYQISVHKPQSVRQVFQGLLGQIMKNIQDSKIRVQDVVIKDTTGKVKLRKFDFKTYQYFQKRYNRCC